MDNSENDDETSQEQIMPCQSIKDVSITHQVKHSGCKICDSYDGVSLIIRIKIVCKNKARQSLNNIVGFYVTIFFKLG